jgi:hypothetical protein
VLKVTTAKSVLQKQNKMSSIEPIVPEDSEFLTEEDLLNPDNQIIFVQHSDEIDRERIAQNFERYLEKNRGKDLSFREINDSPCYPVAFGDGKMVVARKFDNYFVALPRRK